MTRLNEENTQVIYVANGVQTFFEFDVDMLPESSVVVYIDTVLTTDGFTVQSNGISFAVAPVEGTVIRITRETGVTQLRNWEVFDRFEADKTEAAADKLIMLKDEASDFRAAMNLALARTPGDVTLLNDKGTDSVTPLWHHTLDESGMFNAIVDVDIPIDGTPSPYPNSTVWMQFPDIPPPPDTEDTAIIVNRSGPNGQLSMEMNFSGAGGFPETARSQMMGGFQRNNFTLFVVWQWTADDPGPVFRSVMFDMNISKISGGNYAASISLTDISGTTQLISGTYPFGDVFTPGQGDIDLGDWCCLMLSVKNINVPDPNRHSAYLYNFTRGTEKDYSGDLLNMSSGLFEMRINTEREEQSRMSILNVRIGEVDGTFGFEGGMAAFGFDFTELDFTVPSNRHKIATVLGVADHGVGAVNVFGQKAAWYCQGNPFENTGYLNSGNPFIQNDLFAYGTDGAGTRPPYLFPTYRHPLGDWEYATMAAADASGDAWKKNDIIYIDEGAQVLVYDDLLLVDGHNGLRHKYPFGDDTQYLTPTVIESHPEGADPDTWGFVDLSTGTKGVDYDFDVSVGRARFRKLTAAGVVAAQSANAIANGNDATFAIMDRMTAISPDNFTGTFVYLGAGNVGSTIFCGFNAYDNAAVPTPPEDAWAMQFDEGGSTYENTTALWAGATEERFWVYLRDDRASVWSDTGPLLHMDGSRPNAPGDDLYTILMGTAANATLSELLVGTVVFGSLT